MKTVLDNARGTAAPARWRRPPAPVRAAAALACRVLAVAAVAATPAAAWAAPAGVDGSPLSPRLSLSVMHEVRSSLWRGRRYLLGCQRPDGSWSWHPVITGYAALALANLPQPEDAEVRTALAGATRAIVADVQADGGIWNARTRPYPVYSTATAVLPLVRLQRPEHEPALRLARARLAQAQCRDVPPDDPRHGGFSAAPGHAPALITTQAVLEALYLMDRAAHDAARGRGYDPEERLLRRDQTYGPALLFLSRCQRRHAAAGSPDPGLAGTFADHPDGVTGERETATTTPRSTAFLTFSGLKSLIYAGVRTDDPRLTSTMDWICRNFTVAENPGLGTVGLYTYLYMAAKALDAWELRSDTVGLPRLPRWRERIANRLLSLQDGSGRWRHDDPRWWETQPELVTAYAMLTLELLGGGDLRQGDNGATAPRRLQPAP